MRERRDKEEKVEEGDREEGKLKGERGERYLRLKPEKFILDRKSKDTSSRDEIVILKI